jgi:hypothetical protein
MTRTQNLEDHILEILSQAPCSLDELVSACPDATWGHIFGEVDRLSRAGRLTLQRRGRGTYIISTSNHKGGRHEHVSTVGTV